MKKFFVSLSVGLNVLVIAAAGYWLSVNSHNEPSESVKSEWARQDNEVLRIQSIAGRAFSSQERHTIRGLIRSINSEYAAPREVCPGLYSEGLSHVLNQ